MPLATPFYLIDETALARNLARVDIGGSTLWSPRLGRCVQVVQGIPHGGVRGGVADRVEGPGLGLGGQHHRGEQREQHHGPHGHPPPHAVR